MKIRYRSLKISDPSLRSEYVNGLEKIMNTGMFMMGKYTKKFEKDFAKYCDKKNCVGVSNGTSGVYLALKAIGVGNGDEVITTTMSWLATANAIFSLGAKPIFIDVMDDLNMDPDLIEKEITKKTKAIIAVHFCGRICEIEKIKKIASKNKIKLIEDSSQAAGATFNGRKAGFWGHLSAFSMNPMKPLGALGEAGAIVFNDSKMTKKIQSFRYLGTKNIEICEYPEMNHKIDEIQSIWLSIALSKLNSSLELRRKKALQISRLLTDKVKVLGIENPKRTTFFEFTIDCDDRDKLKKYLEKKGIETRIKHPVLMCDQPGYLLKKKYKVPNSRRLVKRILSLPLHENLSNKEISYMTKQINSFYD